MKVLYLSIWGNRWAGVNWSSNTSTRRYYLQAKADNTNEWRRESIPRVSQAQSQQQDLQTKVDNNNYCVQTGPYLTIFLCSTQNLTLEGGMVDLKQSETQQPHIQDTEIQP